MAPAATASLVGYRISYWGRCIDWVITAPLLLLDLALLALANWRREVDFVATLTGLDLFVILTSLLAGPGVLAFSAGFWFIVSTAAMIVVLYLVYTHLFAAASNQSGVVQGVFVR